MLSVDELKSELDDDIVESFSSEKLEQIRDDLHILAEIIFEHHQDKTY